MAEKAVSLDFEFKSVDDARIGAQKYLVGLAEDEFGSRSLLFDDSPTFTKSMTTVEKIAAMAELMVFIDARIRALEANI
jgi:hypothetical protein